MHALHDIQELACLKMCMLYHGCNCAGLSLALSPAAKQQLASMKVMGEQVGAALLAYWSPDRLHSICAALVHHIFPLTEKELEVGSFAMIMAFGNLGTCDGLQLHCLTVTVGTQWGRLFVVHANYMPASS